MCRAATSIDLSKVMIMMEPAWVVETLGEHGAQTLATSQSRDGDAYRCVLYHREIRNLNCFDQHLQSSAHESTKYHCPPEWNGCRTQFKTLVCLYSMSRAKHVGLKDTKGASRGVIRIGKVTL